MLAMVKAGLGITLIPEMVVEQAVRQGNVTCAQKLFRISYERVPVITII
ncbi:Protein of unknown function [Bacillus mycoides]|uniref:LysR substrate-binding domain-containing protein n=1 Tax=Bacillus mycoides TaxID=1405 RepID=A0A1G4ERV9_BACMY|nr:Protein of unknown function [Bacillus mycoides]